MKFSLGLWDTFFGKKVTIELPGSCGKPVKRCVTAKWLEKMEADGMIKKVNEEVIRVHILDPTGGVDFENINDPDQLMEAFFAAKERGHYRVEYWRINKDIPAEFVTPRRDKTTGDLYVVVKMENGKRVMNAVPRDLWEQGKAQMDAL